MELKRVMSEAHFLAGEDARGVLVVFEPETDLSYEHLLALEECGAAGFVSDYTLDRFEKPDVAPELVYDRKRFAGLVAVSVSPRVGVRLRTWAAKGDPAFRVRIGDDGSLEMLPPPAPVKRDKTNDPEIDGNMIRDALANVGVRKGDLLLVHSSLSACGHIAGGAQTVVEALIDAVGADGHLFFPTFQRSECFLSGEVSKRWDHRPADQSARASGTLKCMGAIPIAFMRLHPEAPRGAHISHSWAGWGKRAAEILSAQKWDEPAFSDNSCPYKVMELGGKVLHFGTSLGRTSFMHCLETHFHVPGASAPAFFQVRLPNGEIVWKPLEMAFYGTRETTRLDEHSRFFREAVAEGLQISEVKLGVGRLRLFDCRRYWEIGAKLIARDPSINIGKVH